MILEINWTAFWDMMVMDYWWVLLIVGAVLLLVLFAIIKLLWPILKIIVKATRYIILSPYYLIKLIADKKGKKSAKPLYK